MKKFLLIILFLPLLLKSQDYLPFPLDSVTWYVVHSYKWPSPPYFYYSTNKYEAKGDTSINSVLYSKIIRIGSNGSEYYSGAYRVNAENRTVFYYDKFDSLERLVYDYSLAPNDTINSFGIELICQDTGNLILADTIHKYQTMLNPAIPCIQTWVEGIGSLGYPFIEPYEGCAYTFEDFYDLSCFYYKNEQIYFWVENPFFEDCEGQNIMGINEAEHPGIKLIPNPVTGISKIVAPDNYANGDLEIIDLMGRVKRLERNCDLNSISINKTDFESGVYILKIKTRSMNNYHSIKMIVY